MGGEYILHRALTFVADNRTISICASKSGYCEPGCILDYDKNVYKIRFYDYENNYKICTGYVKVKECLPILLINWTKK